MSKKFKMMKVFDCQSMPADVRKNFFLREWCVGNDCYVSYHNEDCDDEDCDDEDCDDEDCDDEDCDDEDCDDEVEPLFVKWLKENGLESSDEEVLIKHWW